MLFWPQPTWRGVVAHKLVHRAVALSLSLSGLHVRNDFWVSVKRTQDILLLDHEMAAQPPPNTVDRATPVVKRAALSMVDFSSGWPAEASSTDVADVAGDLKSGRVPRGNSAADAPPPAKLDLQNINLAVNFGELAVVMGPVGSGKTTLLLSILGELAPRVGSQLDTSGTSVLYAPQQAWVFPGTFRANICFMYAYESSWFAEVCDACGLVRDLALFQSADLTEIGERGVTLSGGQKARVSLARTVYASRFASGGSPCIVLLDDPFAAVDPSVGQEMFGKALRGLLSTHAVVLVTHHLHLSAHADVTLHLDRDGTPIQGDQCHFAPDIAADASDAPAVKSIDEIMVAPNSTVRAHPRKAAAGVNAGQGVIAAEKREFGAISVHIYRKYLRAAGSLPLVVVAFVLMVGAQAALVAADLWLAEWSNLSFDDQAAERDGGWQHLKVYSALVAIFVALTFARSSVYMRLSINASRGLHDMAFRGIMACSLSFFDAQPVGRIMNRFAKDIGYLDELLPETCLDFISLAWFNLASLAVVCAVDPWLAIAVLPCAVVFVGIRSYYIRTARDVKRIEGTSRSPVYAHLGQSLDGLAVLHSQPGAVAHYQKRFEELEDDHTRAWITFIGLSRWLGSRLDAIVLCVTVATVFAAVANRGGKTAGDVGLSLLYIMQLADAFQWCVRQSAEVENQLTSCERIVEYGDLPMEVNEVCERDDVMPAALLPNGGATGWPIDGSLDVSGLSLWYSNNAKPALNGVNFNISTGEKVGVVGRTGAGKSSLFAALLRCYPTSGDVSIGGVNTKLIKLELLRQCTTVIPQDPV